MLKILFLAANPLDTGRLQLEAEARDIQDGLERSTQRDQIAFDCRFAIRIRDLRRRLLDSRPQVVHFSGHGDGPGGIVLEDDAGDSILVETKALANLFELHKETVECVLLNACYSEQQAKAIAKHIPVVIGMADSVADETARIFAVAFYDALSAGKSYGDAFLHGRNAIELHGLGEEHLPVLLDTGASRLKSPLVLSDASPSTPETSEITIRSRHRMLLEELALLAVETTKFVPCIGSHKSVPFDQLYQPTKLLYRSGLNISASAAFGEQGRMAQAIAVSLGKEFRPLTVERLLDFPEDAIIFAGPGWGKTTFLHHLFRRKSTEHLAQTVLITLRREDAVNNLEELSRTWLSDREAVTRKVLLLVDGYDEVTLNDRKRVSESLQRFTASRAGRYILTCRDFYHVIGLQASHVRIDAFDRKDQYQFVTAFLRAQQSMLDPIKLVNELEQRHFSEFLSHPLLLALACIVSMAQRGDHPRSALRLLKRALLTLQHTWDWERGVAREAFTQLDGEDRMQILKRIAFAARTPFMRAERAEMITRKVLDRMPLARTNPELVLQETAQFYGILVPIADGWEFVHRTIQDFLAAQYWVDSGNFASQKAYEWDTRTAYAACISGDATRVLEGALAAPDGLTCAIETLTNSPDFDLSRVGTAVFNFYNGTGRLEIFSRTEEELSADVEEDLFRYLSPRFLNHLIEAFAGRRTPVSDAIVGYCLSELRARKLRMDYTTHERLTSVLPSGKYRFRLSHRELVTPEMARPIAK